MPSRFWSDAVATAVYLLNMMPSKVLDFKTPLQVLSTHVSLPAVLMLPPRIFGCVAFVHLHKNQRTKLDPCAVRCAFLGYGLHKKGYMCFDPTTNRTYITMDVTFLESEPFFHNPIHNSSLQGENTNEEINWLMAPEAGRVALKGSQEDSLILGGTLEGSSNGETEQTELDDNNEQLTREESKNQENELDNQQSTHEESESTTPPLTSVPA